MGPDRPSPGPLPQTGEGDSLKNPRGTDRAKCCGGPPTLLPCFAMWRRRILHGVVLLGSASALTISCSGSSAVDMWIGSDAGSGFDAPVRETGSTGTGGAGGATGAGSDQGMGGSGLGGSGDTGTGGDGGSVDAGSTD